jgi:hypothetical protein
MKMARIRRSAAVAVLGLLLLGIGAGAEAALASGACCTGMPDMGSGPGAPCRSLAPSSCCEQSAFSGPQSLPGAPQLASGIESPTPAPPAHPVPLHPDQPGIPRRTLATTVLRL